MVRAIPFSILAALLLLTFAPSGRPDSPVGEQRLLILRLTWGPETAELSEAEIGRSVERASAYVREASYGKTWLTHETTSWLHAWSAEPSTCDYSQLSTFTTEVARQSGYDLARFSHLVFVFPYVAACRWGGSYNGNVIWLNSGIPYTTLAHELGHTYGLPEEGPALVGGRPENYANPYTVMGHGQEHFTAWEKWVFGWLERVVRPARAGTFSIDALERPSQGAQALAVTIARDEYWFEYRPAHGVLAYGGVNGLQPGRFVGRNVLLGPVGDGFRVAGAFEVRVAGGTPERATLAFRWLDRTRPPRPRVRVRGRVVEWDPVVDGGSGIVRYEVHAGKRVRVVPAWRSFGRATVQADTRVTLAGRPVRVVAVDRAGNRSR